MALSSGENVNRRIGLTRKILENAFNQDAPERNANLGVESQRMGVDALEQLMNPYMDYWGGSDLVSEQAAQPLTSKLNTNFMNLNTARQMASGRSYDISNIGNRRSDIFNNYMMKRGMASGLRGLEKDLSFRGSQSALDRQAMMKKIRTQLEFEKEQARQRTSAAEKEATGGAWADFLAMIPAVIATIYGGPAAGTAAYGGARSINRSIGGMN